MQPAEVVVVDNDDDDDDECQQRAQQHLGPQQQQAQQQVGRPQRPKVSQRSQSSPSSLTTHKFGLRPTPSPPRLVIDHRTGDIVESYPEHLVYLRTYQPLEEPGDEEPEEPPGELAWPCRQHSDSLGEPDDLEEPMRAPAVIPPPHSARGRVCFAEPGPNAAAAAAGHLSPIKQQQQPAGRQLSRQANHDLADDYHHLRAAAEAEATDDDELEAKTDIAIVTAGAPEPIRVTATSGSRSRDLMAAAARRLQQQQQARQALGQQHQPHQPHQPHQQHQQPHQQHQQPHRQHQQPPPTQPAHQGQIQRRPQRRDQIARPISPKARPEAKPKQSGPKQAAEQAHWDANWRLQEVVDKLYNWAFVFRALLGLALSAAIVYLLLAPPLALDCQRYRPTYSQLSVVVASVNLAAIGSFSLFWLLRGLGRQLYENLSSSAFIIAIYTILVAINFGLAILLFFVNTCHFERQLAEPSARAFALADQLLALEAASGAPVALLLSGGGPDEEPAWAATGTTSATGPHRDHSRRFAAAPRPSMETNLDAETASLNHDATSGELEAAGDDHGAPAGRDSAGSGLSGYHEPGGGGGTARAPGSGQVSPMEAAWEYATALWLELRLEARHFLFHYDLKLVGALHALCAVCLQYLAMRVAVVRSHWASAAGWTRAWPEVAG